jgi:hypothetical protein
VAEYVNNDEFLVAITKYRESVLKSKELGTEKPVVPNYIGDCILKIATHLSYKPNFINYTYKDEMILDGVENCIRYIDNFDPAKSNNPFAYFTQIIYYAFIHRITREKKHAYIKHKLIQNMSYDAFEIQDHDDENQFMNAYLDFMQNNSNFDESFITKKEEKRKRKSKTNLDEFIGEADGEVSDNE